MTGMKKVFDFMEDLRLNGLLVEAISEDHDTFRSDHDAGGRRCGLRAKLPCGYEGVMGVSLVMNVPGVTHVGAEIDAPAVSNRSAPLRGQVFFSQDSAQSGPVADTHDAVCGFFDGSSRKTLVNARQISRS